MSVMTSYLHMLKIMFGILLFASAFFPSNAIKTYTMDHFNVMDYGAISDGRTDTSEAFLKAWRAACNASVEQPTVVVPPSKSFLLNPVIFQGPCVASKINFLISGRIRAPKLTSIWDGKDASQWLAFKDVSGLNLDGFGTVDGCGSTWWNQSCIHHHKPEKCTKRVAPTIMNFLSCNATSVSNLVFRNSGRVHIVVYFCNYFTANKLSIHSPGISPNTDGIHIQASNHVIITNSNIGCGDDCISIGDYTYDIQVANIKCGPGHGISIGSLGKSGNYVQVEKIHVSDSFFSQTQNGARIKTWQVGRGYVRDVIFQNLTFHRVGNPIIIDQYYFCNDNNQCLELETGVQISNVTYREISGTSSSEIAINLKCDRSVPCYGMTMESIHLKPSKNGMKIAANCSNAHGHEKHVVPGPMCLLP